MKNSSIITWNYSSDFVVPQCVVPLEAYILAHGQLAILTPVGDLFPVTFPGAYNAIGSVVRVVDCSTEMPTIEPLILCVSTVCFT